MSQHLTVAPDPGRQARDNSLNQGASCGSGLGGGAATVARAKHRTAAQPIQLYSASRPWTDRRRVWRGFIVLMAPYRAALFYRIPPDGRAHFAGRCTMKLPAIWLAGSAALVAVASIAIWQPWSKRPLGDPDDAAVVAQG